MYANSGVAQPPWITVDVWHMLTKPGIIVAREMEPYRNWCIENIGPVGGLPLIWYNDLYGSWARIHFRYREDAAAFILMSGGKIIDAEV